MKRLVFSDLEIHAMTEMPDVLRALAHSHDLMAKLADAFEFRESTATHIERAAELRATALYLIECRQQSKTPYGEQNDDSSGYHADPGRKDPGNTD